MAMVNSYVRLPEGIITANHQEDLAIKISHWNPEMRFLFGGHVINESWG
jgi:hypothetical protein